ncbi:very short patch repair endonuclease [bacterium]|nr:very short patch repair endonuclease [bacterium]
MFSTPARAHRRAGNLAVGDFLGSDRRVTMARAPSYVGRSSASARASAAARASSRKAGTRCEEALRRALARLGYRYRRNVTDLPGKPDFVFPRARVVVFCDGDFWHGRDFEARRARLRAGTNADYWIAKISRNRERDREQAARLRRCGWKVLRFWESDIRRSAERAALAVRRALEQRLGCELKSVDSLSSRGRRYGVSRRGRGTRTWPGRGR